MVAQTVTWRHRTSLWLAKSALTSLKAKKGANLGVCAICYRQLWQLYGNGIRNVLGGGEGTYSQAEPREAAALGQAASSSLPAGLSLQLREKLDVKNIQIPQPSGVSFHRMKHGLQQQHLEIPGSVRKRCSWPGCRAARETHQPQHLGNPLSRLGSTQGKPCCRAFLYQLYLQDKTIDLSSTGI